MHVSKSLSIKGACSFVGVEIERREKERFRWNGDQVNSETVEVEMDADLTYEKPDLNWRSAIN